MKGPGKPLVSPLLQSLLSFLSKELHIFSIGTLLLLALFGLAHGIGLSVTEHATVFISFLKLVEIMVPGSLAMSFLANFKYNFLAHKKAAVAFYHLLASPIFGQFWVLCFHFSARFLKGQVPVSYGLYPFVTFARICIVLKYIPLFPYWFPHRFCAKPKWILFSCYLSLLLFFMCLQYSEYVD
jgi:hypothetical protein